MFVYFVRGETTGLIKIGTAEDPYRRVDTLQIGSPDQLFLLAYAPGGFPAEGALHRRFAADKSHGEWFKPSPELDAVIAAAAAFLHDATAWWDGDRRTYPRPPDFCADVLLKENGNVPISRGFSE